jgi:DNA-binding NtrC family response regulator
MQKLGMYHWPGNVRELENAIEKAVIMSRQDLITPDLLPSITAVTEAPLKPLTEAKEDFERNYLKSPNLPADTGQIFTRCSENTACIPPRPKGASKERWRRSRKSSKPEKRLSSRNRPPLS